MLVFIAATDIFYLSVVFKELQAGVAENSMFQWSHLV